MSHVARICPRCQTENHHHGSDCVKCHGSLAPAAGSALWQHVIQSDSTVAHGLNAGLSLQQIIVQLVLEKEKTFKRLFMLESIAPRKITMPDGTVMVWHCPDNLIPEAPNGEVSDR